MMDLVIDIDDTLIISDKEICPHCGRTTYKNARPIQEEINYLKIARKRGDRIILYTGRGWDCYKITKEQLRIFHVPYDALVMGKPQGIYIDKDSITSLRELNDKRD